MKHIKPRGYTESRPSGDGIHRYEVIVSEKKHYCKRIECCDDCNKRVRFWCRVIRRIEDRQNQIIADMGLNTSAAPRAPLDEPQEVQDAQTD